LAVETKQQQEKHDVERYPDKNASKIQNAISILSDMETKLGGLSGQVSDMKKKLLNFAETESEKAKAEVIEQANKEAQDAMEQVRQSAQKDADAIITRGMAETNQLRARISAKVSDAVEIIVEALQSA